MIATFGYWMVIGIVQFTSIFERIFRITSTLLNPFYGDIVGILLGYDCNERDVITWCCLLLDGFTLFECIRWVCKGKVQSTCMTIDIAIL